MKKYHLVYKITNLTNNKEYIGVHCTNNINDDYYGSSIDLCNDIILLGLENFKRETIFFAKTREEAFLKEKELVTSDYTLRKDTYNKQLGGSFTYDMTGWVWIYNVEADIRKRMPSDSIDEWYKAGWQPLKEIWVYKDEDTRRIPIQQKEKWINSGYALGCAYNRKRIKISNVELNIEKSILEEELENYLELGWTKGRIVSPCLGKIRITNSNNEEKAILLEDLDYYEELGWYKGGKTGFGGKIYIHNILTLEHKAVTLDQVGVYLKDGWLKGNLNAVMVHLYKDGDKEKERITLNEEEFHLKKHYNSLGYSCLKHTKGKKHMYKGDKSTSVSKDQIEIYLADGWLLGRSLQSAAKKEIAKAKKANPKSIKGTKWLNKNKKSIRVNEAEFNDLVLNGWKPGRYIPWIPSF